MITDTISVREARDLIAARFESAAIPVAELLTRDYPDETVFVIHVPASHLEAAAELGNRIDQDLHDRGFEGFVTVRRVQLSLPKAKPFRARTGVADDRVSDLVALISERARTSEAQPSLHYVRDAEANLVRVRARRHSLIFGRRGAGKTALMLEAKRQVAEEGELSVWLNLQTYRREPVQRVVLWVAGRICDTLLTDLRPDAKQQVLTSTVAGLRASIEQMLGLEVVDVEHVYRLAPQLQAAIQRFTQSTGKRIYIFLDDVHYIQRSKQPDLLDLLHGMVRDADAWLKIAAIRHFSKWYRINPPTGLQATQDADSIDLDLTLQEPVRAKQFLEEVLLAFAQHVGIPSLNGVFVADALDRLVLASGAVPRDYLVLAGNAIGHARRRENARVVGKQDVATAAGDIAQAKMAELEEDAAAATGSAQQMISALQVLRDFCIDDRKYTFFQIDFKDKETKVNQYTLLQSLMDVRLIHIVNASVSDAHQAGERSEAYMLDSSQFSGSRFKKYLKVLDLIGGQLVMKETGTTKAPRLGDTPRKLITILRSAPHFSLDTFTSVLNDREAVV
jgi:hypothetical protein